MDFFYSFIFLTRLFLNFKGRFKELLGLRKQKVIPDDILNFEQQRFMDNFKEHCLKKFNATRYMKREALNWWFMSQKHKLAYCQVAEVS